MGQLYHTKSITRREVEEKLKGVGDYVKMDFLAQCLKKQIDFDTKKFILLKLAEIYEQRKMFSEAGKMMRSAAEINATYDGKMSDFMKSCTLFIKGGNLEDGDTSFTKAIGCANGMQKDRLKSMRKEALKAQAKEFMNKDRRSHALTVYEKLLTLELTPDEKKEAQSTLIGIYEKLGKVREFYALKANMG
jgi:tetratricopeptide (TPR) repeat protein